MASLRDLPRALGKIHRQLVVAVAQVQTKVAFDMIVELAKATPVATSRCQSNWFMSLTEVVPNRDFPPYHAEGQRDGPGLQIAKQTAADAMRDLPERMVAPAARGTAPVYIGNVTPYLQYLDQGSSPQAEANFVSQTAGAAFARATRDLPNLFGGGFNIGFRR